MGVHPEFLAWAMPAQSQPPVHVILDSPRWSFLLPLLTPLIAVFTFLLGYGLRIRERRAAWYQKVVVDYALEQLFGLFALAEAEFGTPTAEPVPEDAERQTIPRKYTIAMGNFSERLIRVQNGIYERLVVFSEKGAEELVRCCEALQDDITDWFEKVFVYKRTNAGELRAVFLAAQRRLVKLLYEFEFKQF